MLDLLRDEHGGNAIASIARSLGVAPDQAKTAAATIAEALSRRIERATLSRGGLGDLVEIIGAPGRQAYLQPGASLTSPEVQADGIGVLSQILGSRDKSRAVAASAARQSGLSEDAVKAMLPSVAAVLMGALSKSTSRAFGDILKIPGLDEIAKEARDDMGGGGQLAPPQYGSPLPLPGQPPRRSIPHTDWTGSAGSAAPPVQPQTPPPSQPQGPTTGGGVGRQMPLPVPGDDVPGMGRHEDNPYGDLGDILRRGGFRIPEGFPIPGGSRRPSTGPAPSPEPGGGGPDYGNIPGGGGALDSIIRNILGNILGFQNNGILSWIIRLIVMRWGVGFIRSLVRRLLGINI